MLTLKCGEIGEGQGCRKPPAAHQDEVGAVSVAGAVRDQTGRNSSGFCLPAGSIRRNLSSPFLIKNKSAAVQLRAENKNRPVLTRPFVKGNKKPGLLESVPEPEI